MARSKVISGIDCDAAAATGIRPVLSSRLDEMCCLRERALKWDDPEGVHDMRVASRRLRGALHDFMPFLRKRSLTSSLKQIKTIADSLGQVRDQDVAIMALEKLATKAPAEVSTALSNYVDLRKTVRDKAREELARALSTEGLSQLESEFAVAIDRATTEPAPRERATTQHPVTAPLSYRKVSRSIILERLKEFEKLSNSLYLPLETDPLHKMRIAAKRLRYALELFEQCWGPSIKIFANKAAGLQSSLGEVHDCDVWIESFGKELMRAKKEGAPGDASAWLLSHFLKVRTRHLRNSLARWREWEANKFSSQLRESLQMSSTVHRSD